MRKDGQVPEKEHVLEQVLEPAWAIRSLVQRTPRLVLSRVFVKGDEMLSHSQ